MSAFTAAVFAERALLAWTDPAGEADAVCPMDAVDAYFAMLRFIELCKPRVAPLAVGSRTWDNESILGAIGARPGRTRGMVRCPAHEDHLPSLSWRIEGDRLLLNCFAGCSFEEILEAVA